MLVQEFGLYCKEKFPWHKSKFEIAVAIADIWVEYVRYVFWKIVTKLIHTIFELPQTYKWREATQVGNLSST